LRFFRWFGKERTAALTFICSDMWKPYLKVVAKKAGHALHILDRFHIAKAPDGNYLAKFRGNVLSPVR
jgi:transposase